MDLRIPVRVSTPHPCLFVDTDAHGLGDIFAGMGAEDQVKVLAAMMASLYAPGMGLQRDYIAIELAKPENAEVCERLAYLTAEITA